MIKNPTVLQEMDMKDDFRKLIKTHGIEVGLQCLYEIVKTGEWLAEIILEAQTKEHK